MSRKTVTSITATNIPAIPMEGDRLLNTKETASIMGLKPGTLTRARVLGTQSYPPYLKIAHSVRYRLSTVMRWLDEQQEQQHTSANAA